MPKVIPDTAVPGRYLYECPACKCCHFFDTLSDGPKWEWNGDAEAPVVKPSVRVRFGRDMKLQCHFYIGGSDGSQPGKIVYLTDCTHALAGQTVELPYIGAEELE